MATAYSYRMAAVDSNNNAYAATDKNGLYKTDDNGTIWNPVNNGLSNFSVEALKIDSSDRIFADGNDNLFIATTSRGIYKLNSEPYDLLGTWDGSGVWYRNFVADSWIKMCNTPADLIAAGDLDGDSIDDLIGIWSSGVWVKYSETGSWTKICTSLPSDIAAGKMRGGVGSAGVEGFMNFLAPIGGYAKGPRNLLECEDLSS